VKPRQDPDFNDIESHDRRYVHTDHHMSPAALRLQASAACPPSRLELMIPRLILGSTGLAFARVLSALAALGLVYAVASAAPGANVEGTVVDASTGQPIPGAWVRAPAFDLTVITDSQGGFTLSGIPLAEPSLPTVFEIDAPGYGRWTIRDVRLVAGDVLFLDAELGPDPVVIVVPPPRAVSPDWPAGVVEQALRVQGAAASLAADAPLPATIRVRVTGYPHCDISRPYTVEVVDFKEYAKHVLPNEWVNSWPWESLRAGAMAVKMYAWSYVAAGGKWPDADVYDSTCDQVYNPAVSYASTNQSVDFTWNWRLTRGSSLPRLLPGPLQPVRGGRPAGQLHGPGRVGGDGLRPAHLG
jgi:hypothetical protein